MAALAAARPAPVDDATKMLSTRNEALAAPRIESRGTTGAKIDNLNLKDSDRVFVPDPAAFEDALNGMGEEFRPAPNA
ncbi:hypothetical protein CDD81_4719 [Ophiocordyceps australis]|uniref:Uncharacterized protein n=1 Tax=Ophiocordyceps australis TaxID=1399860 RepID=A0A2C5YAS1_9HYPO|nr:hypothetical protein CDD81_4719 [Ophiocordyceps australis]